MTIELSSVQYYLLRQSFVRMIGDLDASRMATAINVLSSGEGQYINPDELVKNIQGSYRQIIDSWGPPESDGSLSIDLEKATTSIGPVGQYMLSINLEADFENWEWRLELPVTECFVENEVLI